MHPVSLIGRATLWLDLWYKCEGCFIFHCTWLFPSYWLISPTVMCKCLCKKKHYFMPLKNINLTLVSFVMTHSSSLLWYSRLLTAVYLGGSNTYTFIQRVHNCNGILDSIQLLNCEAEYSIHIGINKEGSGYFLLELKFSVYQSASAPDNILSTPSSSY